VPISAHFSAFSSVNAVPFCYLPFKPKKAKNRSGRRGRGFESRQPDHSNGHLSRLHLAWRAGRETLRRLNDPSKNRRRAFGKAAVSSLTHKMKVSLRPWEDSDLPLRGAERRPRIHALFSETV
jgi:hypothetical protein